MRDKKQIQEDIAEAMRSHGIEGPTDADVREFIDGIYRMIRAEANNHATPLVMAAGEMLDGEITPDKVDHLCSVYAEYVGDPTKIQWYAVREDVYHEGKYDRKGFTMVARTTINLASYWIHVEDGRNRYEVRTAMKLAREAIYNATRSLSTPDPEYIPSH